MVKNNLSYAVNLGGGGTTTKKPQNLSYSDNLLGGVKNPTIKPPAPIQTPALSYQNNVGNMVGVGSKGGFGGVTNEGAVIGNPNVENMPRIAEKTNTSYAANLPTAASAPQNTPAVASYSAPQTPAQGSAPASTPATVSESGERLDSYEEFLMKQGGMYKDLYEKMLAQIEQNKQNVIAQAESQRQQTEQQAEAERQRGVIDARSSHEQNKATYGANAEMLAGMGLSGSGYSDYINQQAYATQRAETQAANAQSEATKLNAKYTADAAKLGAEQQASSDQLNAELSYAQNMSSNDEKLAQYQQKKEEEAKAAEEQKKQYYAMLLTSANTGEYTSEQLSTLAAQYGLDEAQIAELQGAADSYKSKQQSISYTEAMQMISDYGSDLDVSYLDTLLSSGSISQEQYDDLLVRYNKELAESGDINSADTGKIDDMYESGKIEQETYENQKKQWNSNIDTTDGFFNSGSMTAAEAKKLLNQTIGNAWCTEETKAALQKTYDRLYTPIQNDVSFNNDGGWWIFGSTDMADKGNNFSLKDSSGFVYRIESGGEVTDATIKSLASNVSGGIFGLRGEVYYKKDGKIYLVQKRENTYKDHYEKLHKKFFG